MFGGCDAVVAKDLVILHDDEFIVREFLAALRTFKWVGVELSFSDLTLHIYSLNVK